MVDARPGMRTNQPGAPYDERCLRETSPSASALNSRSDAVFHVEPKLNKEQGPAAQHALHRQRAGDYDA